MHRTVLILIFAVVSVIRVAYAESVPEVAYHAETGADLTKFRYNAFFGELFRIRTAPDGTILALNNTGTFLRRSGDGKWSRSWTNATSMYDFAIDKDGTLWSVGFKGRMSHSKDGGASWATRYAVTKESLFFIQGSPAKDVLIAGGAKGTLIRSEDHGANWQPVNAGTDENDLRAILYSPDGRAITVVGGKGYIAAGGVGSQMLKPRARCSTRNLNDIASSPDGSRIAIVGDSGTICLSDNAGATWRQTKPINFSTLDIKAVVFDAVHHRFVAAGEAGYFFVEESGGWRPIILDWLDAALFSMTVDRSGTRLLAAGRGGAIMASTDGGYTWAHIDENPRPHDSFRDVGVSTDGALVIAVTGDGTVLTSTDHGRNFSATSLDGATLSAVAVAPSGQQAFAGTSAGDLYAWENGTGTWKKLGLAVTEEIMGMAMNGAGTVLMVVTDEGSIFQVDVRAGTNTLVHSAPPGVRWYAIAASPGGNQFAVVGSDGKAMLSDAAGRSWNELEVGTTNFLTAVAWGSDQRIYIGSIRGDLYLATPPYKKFVYRAATGDSLYGLIPMGDMIFAGTSSGGVIASYDRFLSRSQVTELFGRVTGMAMAPGSRQIWVVTLEHELGFITDTPEIFPKLLSANVPKILSPSSANEIELRFDPKSSCIYTPMKFTVFASPDGSLGRQLDARSAGLANNVATVSFDLPADISAAPFTLRVGTTCDNFFYVYSFYDRRTMAWIDRIPGGYATVAAVCFAIALPLLSVALYFLHPAALLPLASILNNEHIPKTVKPVFSLTAKYLLVGYLCKKRRVLEGWVHRAHRHFSEQWKLQVAVQENAGYTPLPVAIQSKERSDVIEYPNGKRFRAHMHPRPLVIQIVGRAGIGKTTLAISLCEAMMEGDLFGYVALPVLLPSNNQLQPKAAFDMAMTQMFGEYVPDPEMVRNLLRQGYLVPVIDRLSERPPTFEGELHALLLGVGVALVTTRRAYRFAGNGVRILPLPITSIAVMSGYVENELRKIARTDEHFSMGDTADIVNVLAHTVGRSADRGEMQEITPLLLTTFVALAVDFLREGIALTQLPTSSGRVYLNYVYRFLDSTLPFATAALKKACGELGRLSLINRNGPGAIDPKVALPLLDEVLGPGGGERLLEHLVSAGILGTEERLAIRRVYFVIDSFAEVLAATYIVDNPLTGREFAQTLAHPGEGAFDGASSADQILLYVDDLSAPPG